MKLIKRDTDYAIRAIMSIVESNKKLVSVSDLNKITKIPKAFLRKIMQILQKEGILKSYKGKGGGFKLAVSANKIFLTDIIKIFQGNLKLNECIFKRKICPNKKICSLRKTIERIEKFVISELNSITIEDLLKK
ncbi:MAG TPA: Rrf2 family transcriptional regulator [Candidatus Omnitrophica bacterium]|nr:Rrf2 family transcriptional regulator [Candidatus Omnitrophota bacterium]